jgi:hypothetical protein
MRKQYVLYPPMEKSAWIVVPCHRVIGTNGSLTGYAGGLWRKSGYWNTKTQQPSKVYFN